MACLVSEFKPTPTSRKSLICKLSGKCLVFLFQHPNYFKIAEFRMSTPQDVRKKGSEILKLPPVRNCFILTMTNKLVVIINSLKYQKLRNFTMWNEISCTKSQLSSEYLTRGLPPPDLRSLCFLSSTEFVEPRTNKIPGYATARNRTRWRCFVDALCLLRDNRNWWWWYSTSPASVKIKDQNYCEVNLSLLSYPFNIFCFNL